MISPDEKAAVQFLRQLESHLRTGNETYTLYLVHGRSFRHARILKDNNLQITGLIREHAHSLPDAHQQNIMALDHHLNVWHALWDELDRGAAHAPDDVFAFENSVNFPKQSVAALLEYLATLVARATPKD